MRDVKYWVGRRGRMTIRMKFRVIRASVLWLWLLVVPWLGLWLALLVLFLCPTNMNRMVKYGIGRSNMSLFIVLI
jgi:hypothetical protein